MTDDNLNRTNWVLVAFVIIVCVGTFLAAPTYNKIKAQKDAIDNITYTAPS